MTTPTIAEPHSDAQTQRYREAERALWRHYDIEPAERFVDVGGVRLRVLEVGSGESVLFVHGTGGPGAWPALVRELSGCRCLLLDRPGWGLSEPVAYSGRDYRAFVADLLCGVLDVLGLDRAHVAGASIGNVWALALAARHPVRVGRVVLLGGGPLLPEVPVPVFVALVASPLGRIMARRPQDPNTTRSHLRRLGHGASLDAGLIPHEFLDWRFALTRDTPALRNEREMIRALVRGRSFRPGLTFGDRELAAITQPVLHVCGTADPVGSVRAWQRLARLLPDARLELVDGAGHVPWFDDPARVAGEIGHFLRG
ncbi:MAG: alpha/beta hydrolase [Solirubrobacteraceae bacterium]